METKRKVVVKGERKNWIKGVVVHSMPITSDKLVGKKLTSEDLNKNAGHTKRILIP